MPLSEHEQRILDELERSLTKDDRKLAQTLGGGNPHSYGRIALIALGVLIGMLVLLLGAVQEITWVGVAGFVIMFAALAWGITQRRTPGVETDLLRPTEQSPKSFNKTSVGAADAFSKSGFMDRLGDRWDRRQSDSR